jgi:hypothetical protein
MGGVEMKCDKLNAYKGDVTIPVYSTIADAKVYLKSEADKVIAHHKYKRCLAMAKLCRMHDEFTQLESERLGLPQRTLFLEWAKEEV